MATPNEETATEKMLRGLSAVARTLIALREHVEGLEADVRRLELNQPLCDCAETLDEVQSMRLELRALLSNPNEPSAAPARRGNPRAPAPLVRARKARGRNPGRSSER